MANHTIPITPKRLLDYYCKYVDIFESSDVCWNWQGHKMTTGYGAISLGHPKGPNHYRNGAHRLSYQIHYGEQVPEEMYVCHKCDRPSCVNPHHLFLGSNSDNQFDCVKKGRSKDRDAKSSAIHKIISQKRSRNALGRFIKDG